MDNLGRLQLDVDDDALAPEAKESADFATIKWGNVPDDNEKDEDGGHEVGDVGEAHVIAVEGALEGKHFVFFGDEQVEKSHDSAFVLVVTSDGLIRIDGEGLPHDNFANVGGDKEGDAAAEAVLLLKQLVKAEHENTGENKLKDDQQRVQGTDVHYVAIHVQIVTKTYSGMVEGPIYIFYKNYRERTCRTERKRPPQQRR